ncbi:MAG TPA: FecR family protein [Bacteroidales bacterium]|jgi:ferric-dicitrate binding protein FerR (iron transport regulator)|nr:FecR family protein [Bacteroidales bacterium]
MEKNMPDKIFSKKLENITDLPPGTSWNSHKGWAEYEKNYLTKKVPVRKLIIYLSAAAAALFIGIFYLLHFQHYHDMNQVTNETDKIMEFVLPDGNKVWLNRYSSLEYPAHLDKNHNELSVTGEVYFEIRNLQIPSYEIMAHNAVILAEHPGEFNIRARTQEDCVSITVKSGALKIKEVSSTEGLALLVTEGNYCSVHKSQNLVYASSNRNENFLSWKTGNLTFNSLPVATVTDILAEYYNTTIEITDKSLAYCLFTGTFSDQSIDAVMNKLQTDLSVIVRNAGDKITISGKGCL